MNKRFRATIYTFSVNPTRFTIATDSYDDARAFVDLDYIAGYVMEITHAGVETTCDDSRNLPPLNVEMCGYVITDRGQVIEEI